MVVARCISDNKLFYSDTVTTNYSSVIQTACLISNINTFHF